MLATRAFGQAADTGGSLTTPSAATSMPEVRIRPAPIFFPPVPPVLDAIVNRVERGQPYGRQTPPEELGGYVGEIFYPQLGSRLQEKEMNVAARKQLADYRTARDALIQELRQQLADAPEDDAVARRTALEAFAKRQTPKIVQLEQQAEQLRTSLAIRERDWTSLRQWRLGDKNRLNFSPIEISQTIRSYAHYYRGIPLVHRLLLLEIAVEMRLAQESAAAAAAAQRYIFFSPTLSRVMLPDDASSEVAAKTAMFQTKKSLLKKELYDAVLQEESRSLFFANPLRSVAEKQTAAVSALDSLAEEIRIGLGGLGRSVPVVERSPLPVTIAQQLTELAQRRRQYEKEATAKIVPLVARARVQSAMVSYNFEPDGLRYTIVPRTRNLPPEGAHLLETLNKTFTAVAAEYGGQLAELINRGEEIRREAAEFLPDKTPAAITAAINRAMRAVAQTASASAYREYRVAAFEPGLSSGQRRLLFHASIAELDLPLPRGEMQPTERGAAW
ncbi:MAG: hypothetical protein ABIZ49_09545 [Opitutaceae bacterium]